MRVHETYRGEPETRRRARRPRLRGGRRVLREKFPRAGRGKLGSGRRPYDRDIAEKLADDLIAAQAL